MRILLVSLFICAIRGDGDDEFMNSNVIITKENYVEYNNVEQEFNVDNGQFAKSYKPEWADLDTRPIPRWYDKAKVGIFLHWGVFSVPSFGSEWFWSNWKGGSKSIEKFMMMNYPPNFTYQDFAPMFTAEFFDPDKWAQLFADSGARYVVLTSKHHEGFTLFPSHRSYSWNALDIGPKRDLVEELAWAVRKKHMKFGLYHSLYEWYNPIYLEDKNTNFSTRVYPETKLWPDLKQIVEDYKPSVIWVDGDWEANDTYWDSTGFLAWLYTSSPIKDEVVVNDRWGIGIPGHHGDFYNHDDRYNPGVLQSHKWENAFTVDSTSWGYRRNMDINEVLTDHDLLYELASTVSCGGNVLINIGPTKEGTIAPIFQERLLALGIWLKLNGEAIYETSPWTYQNDSMTGDTWYTCKREQYSHHSPTSPPQKDDNVHAIYAIILSWPEDDTLKLKDISLVMHSGNYKAEFLDITQKLDWTINNGVTNIVLPNKSTVRSQNAWVVKFSWK